jgi:hypothetical protein
MLSQFLKELPKLISRGSEIAKQINLSSESLVTKMSLAVTMAKSGDHMTVEALRMQCQVHLDTMFDCLRDGITLDKESEALKKRLEDML